jgi:hypothetical protein
MSKIAVRYLATAETISTVIIDVATIGSDGKSIQAVQRLLELYRHVATAGSISVGTFIVLAFMSDSMSV